ncbi:TPA: amino acid permease, partial [Pseudomonas aeruginosa]|nr:amino acid permease [Pseudomonas aeruginosa]
MSSVGEQKVQDGSLKRELGERHIRLMALGACIGVGLFLGSAKAIQMAGPAIMISYILGGLAILVIMRALGEMAVHNPVAGSFSQYAKDYLGPLAGFITGWNYWFLWLVTCVAEITAVAVYMGIWFPDVPRWIWALAALASMGTINLIAVRAFGEFEFWFALIKIVTILAMVVVGIGMIAFGFGNDGIATGISNLWAHGGFMPNGIQGVLMSLQMVMFAYLGVEMIGLTAGEARNPTKTIPSAINSVFWRILLFYVGSLFVIMSLYPWNEIGTQGSPFVMTFERMGIKTAAGIINFVVITAALSSCNGGIFSTGRMLYSLAQHRQAPAFFGKASRSGVPRRALILSILALLLGVLLNYLVPEKVFVWVTSIATFGAIWTWAMILLAQLRFRK